MTLRAISAIESHRLARCLLSKQLRFSWIKFHRAKCQLNLVSVTMSDKTSNLILFAKENAASPKTTIFGQLYVHTD